MSVSTSTRLGITLWSDGADPFTRAQMEGSHEALEAVVGLFAKGASRPAASGTNDRGFFLDTGTGVLSYSDGSSWFNVVEYGGTGDLAAVGASASGGTGVKVARANHVHTIGVGAINALTQFAGNLSPVFVGGVGALPAGLGQVGYATDTHQLLIDDGTAFRPPWNLPWGQVARAQVGTDQGSISALVDVSGSSLSFVCPANRLIRYTFTVTVTNNAANGTTIVRITKSDNTDLNALCRTSPQGTGDSYAETKTFVWYENVTVAATIARKLRANTDGGVGAVKGTISTTTFIAEDMGPSGNPG